MAFDYSVIFRIQDHVSPILDRINTKFHGIKNTVRKVGDAGKNAFSGIGKTLRSFAGSDLLQASANLSLVSQHVGRLSQSINAMIDKPSEVAQAFETGMARVSTVLSESNAVGGDVVASHAMIAKAAQDMAGGMTEASKLASIQMDEFANSAYTMLSAGLSVEAAIAATSQSALLAKATGGDLSDAASTLTGIYNNFGDLNAEVVPEIRKLSDVVASTQNYFAFENLNQFTQGLKNASGASKAFRVPLEQTAAVIGQLNTNTLIGAQAGTSLKSVLAQMTKASEKLGFEIETSANGGLDLVATLGNVAKLAPTGADLTTAFGTEAGPAVALLVDNLAQLTAGYNAVQNSAGTTLSNATKMADTLAEKQTRVNNIWQVFQERIGGGSNAVKNLALQVSTFTGKMVNAITNVPVFGEKLAMLTGAGLEVGGSLLSVASGAINGATGLLSFMMIAEKVSIIGKAGRAIRMLTSGLFGFAKGIIFAIPKLIVWTATMMSAAVAHIAAAFPIYAIIGAIALVVAGIVMLVKHWRPVVTFLKNVVVGAFDWVKNAIMSVVDWFNRITDNPLIAMASVIFAPFVSIPLLIMKHWGTIKDFFIGVFAGIKEAITATIAFFKPVLDAIIAPVEWLLEKIKALGERFTFLKKIPLLKGIFTGAEGSDTTPLQRSQSSIQNSNVNRTTQNNIVVTVESAPGTDAQVRGSGDAPVELRNMDNYGFVR